MWEMETEMEMEVVDLRGEGEEGVCDRTEICFHRRRRGGGLITGLWVGTKRGIEWSFGGSTLLLGSLMGK